MQAIHDFPCITHYHSLWLLLICIVGICFSSSISSTATEREGPLPLTFGGLHFCGATQARGKAKRRKGRKLLENSPDEQAYAAAYPDMIRGATNYKCLLVTETWSQDSKRRETRSWRRRRGCENDSAVLLWQGVEAGPNACLITLLAKGELPCHSLPPQSIAHEKFVELQIQKEVYLSLSISVLQPCLDEIMV